jgi:hypothetical protein
VDLIQSDWRPPNKRKLGHTHVKTQGEVTICKPRYEASRETSPANSMVLDVSLQNHEEINVCRLNFQGCGVCYAALTN